MPSIRLTKREVDGLKAPDPSGRQVLWWDSEKRGLGVLCSGVSNAKTWIVQANVKKNDVKRKVKQADGTIVTKPGPGFVARRITIAPTNVLDPDQAWERAKTILSEIYAGKDPKAERKREQRASVTVGQTLEDYLTKAQLRERSINYYRGIAQRHLAPWLGRPLRSITGDDVEDRFYAISRDVVAGRAAGKSRGGVNVSGRGSANMALQLFGSLWNFAADGDEQLGSNPTRRLRRRWHKLPKRTRHVSSAEMPAFYQAVLALPNSIHRDLILFALFTGMREMNCSSLRWSDVDLRQRIIRILPARMKNDEIFELPTCDVLHDLLVARRAIGYDGPFVFPGERASGHCQSFSFALNQIAEKTGIRVSPHDLRRSYITCAKLCPGVPSLAVKLLASHTVGQDVTDGYAQLGIDNLRKAAQQVCDHLKALCQVELPQGENVARLG